MEVPKNCKFFRLAQKRTREKEAAELRAERQKVLGKGGNWGCFEEILTIVLDDFSIEWNVFAFESPYWAYSISFFGSKCRVADCRVGASC